MSKVLVICNSNWADEIDLNGFKILEKDEWKAIKAEKKKWFDALVAIEEKRVNDIKAKGGYAFASEVGTICVGTNEYVHYSDYESWKEQFTEKDISDDEAKLLNKLFNLKKLSSFGFFLDDLGEYEEEY